MKKPIHIIRDAVFVIALFLNVGVLIYAVCGAACGLTGINIALMVGSAITLSLLSIIGNRIIK